MSFYFPQPTPTSAPDDMALVESDLRSAEFWMSVGMLIEYNPLGESMRG